MDYRQGTDHNEMTKFCPESSIVPDSFVRVADTFVDDIDLKSFGFAHVEWPDERRPLIIRRFC